MNIGIIVFAYNRNQHLEKVLNRLSKNKGVSRLYIFQDGLRCDEHRGGWEKTKQVIKDIDWCEVVYYQAAYNKGLAKSIVDGVNTVFGDNDAVIVLEDDCVPHPQFMEYMTKALEKYRYDKEVYHIGASAEPVDVSPNGTDAYFLGRINSCGWGTWKDRWEQFSCDYKMLAKVKANTELNEWFILWGQNVESHILGNIYGKTDSWAAFWALTVILKKGYCMSPYESLIKNVGFDGTGVHSGTQEITIKLRPDEKMTPIVLPDKIEFVKDYKRSFANYYPWTSPLVKSEYYINIAWNLLEFHYRHISMAEWMKSKGISKLCIWGRGKLGDCLIHELEGKVTISAIIETNPRVIEYKGIPVMHYKNIPQDIMLVIVVPGYDIDRIRIMVGDDEINHKLVTIDQMIVHIKEYEEE